MSSSTELSLKNLSCDPNYYAECFRVFSRYSSRDEVFTSWVETVFPQNVIEKLALSDEAGQGQLEILGVGSGSGELDCKLISKLLKKFPSISSTVLEPNQDHIMRFKELVGEEKGLSNVVWDWRQQTWEQFYDEWKLMNGGNQKKFHFISAIHSIYHFADTESAIQNLISCLREGGILMINIISDHSSILHLWKRFPMLSDENVMQLNASDVRSILEKHKIGYKAVTQESNIDITCCYEDGNQDGVRLLDFLSYVKLRESAPQSVVEEVLSHMRECAVKDGERILYNNEWQSIFITK